MGILWVSDILLLCLTKAKQAASIYLDGGGGDLDVVQLVQSALPVDEVGGGQLVQSFQSHSCAVGFCHLRCPTQLPLVHKDH